VEKWASVVISSLALAFTLLSFWWMNWRKGKLSVAELQHFAAGKAITSPGDCPNTIIIGLPLVIFNTGASPVVVESLRLVSRQDLGTLLYKAVEEPIWTSEHPIKIERDEFFLPTIIRPNDVVSKNFVFTTGITDRELRLDLYSFDLQVKVSDLRDWKRLKHIELDFRHQRSRLSDQELSPYELNAFYRVYAYTVGERA
jgi:hypothetical protein